MINTHRLMQTLSTTGIGTMKRKLQTLTNVPSKHQKLAGLKLKNSGEKMNDDVVVSDLKLKKQPPHKFMMIGTPAADVFVDPAEEDRPEIIDDLEWDYVVS
jgi:hypothetical protein